MIFHPPVTGGQAFKMSKSRTQLCRAKDLDPPYLIEHQNILFRASGIFHHMAYILAQRSGFETPLHKYLQLGNVTR